MVARKKDFWTLEEAMAFLKDLNIKGKKEYLEKRRAGLLPSNLPSNPQQMYTENFPGWCVYLNNGNISNRQAYRNNLSFTFEFLLEQLNRCKAGNLSHSEMLMLLDNKAFNDAYQSLTNGKKGENLPSLDDLVTESGAIERAAKELARQTKEEKPENWETLLETFEAIETGFKKDTEGNYLSSASTDIYSGNTLKEALTEPIVGEAEKIDEEKVKAFGTTLTQKLLNQLHNGDTTQEELFNSDYQGKPVLTFAINQIRDWIIKGEKAYQKLSEKINIPFEPTLVQKVVPMRVLQEKRHLCIAECGTGKTFMGIATLALTEEKLSVVICPAAVIDDWQIAFRDFYPKANVLTKIEDLEQTPDGTQTVLIISFNTFSCKATAPVRISKLLSHLPGFLIVDESHKTKDGGSHTTQYVAEMSKYITFCLLMTGTVLTSQLSDIEAQVAIIQKTEVPKSNRSSLVRADGNAIKGMLRQALNLNTRLYNLASNWVTIKPPVKVTYNNTIWVDVSNYKNEYTEISSWQERENFLTQFKIDEILKLARDGSIIFCRNIDSFPEIQSALRAKGFVVYCFNSNVADKKEQFEKFLKSKGDGRNTVIIVGTCFGTGINRAATRSNHMICVSNNYTYSEYHQVIHRIIRKNSEFKEVFIDNILATGIPNRDDVKENSREIRERITLAATRGILTGVTDEKERMMNEKTAEAIQEAMERLSRTT